MHEILIRFKFMPYGNIVECKVDERLNFIENFELLEKIDASFKKEFEIYDPERKIFFDKNVPLSQFKINRFILLYVF